MNSLTSGKKLKDNHTGEWVADEQRNWRWESKGNARSADEVTKRIHAAAVQKMQVRTRTRGGGAGAGAGAGMGLEVLVCLYGCVCVVGADLI